MDPWKGAGWWPKASWARRPKLLWKRRGLVLLAGDGAKGLFCKEGRGVWLGGLKRPMRGRIVVAMKRRGPPSFWWLSAHLESGRLLVAGQGRCIVASNPAGDPAEQEAVWGEMKASKGLVESWMEATRRVAWKKAWSTSDAHRCLDAAWSAPAGRIAILAHHSEGEWSRVEMADGRTGRTIWRFGGDYRLSMPWIDGKTVVVADQAHKKIYGLDFEKGRQLWVAPWSGGEPAGFCPLADGVVEDPLSHGKIDLATGIVTKGLASVDGHRVQWQIEDMPHVCAGSKVFGMVQQTGSSDMEVGALDLQYGQVLWHKDLCNGQAVAAMALSGDALMVICRAEQGTPFGLFALAPSDGRELWRMKLDRYRGDSWPAESCRPAKGPRGVAVVGSRLFVAGANTGFLLDFGNPPRRRRDGMQ